MTLSIYTAVSLFLVGLLLNKIYFEFNKGKYVEQSKLVPNNHKIVGQAGIIFILIFFLFFFIDFKLNILNIDWYEIPRFYSLLFCLLILSIISFIDDKYDIPKRVRFTIQIIVCYLSTSALNLNFSPLPFKIELILIVIIWVYLINISNFIDGLNGFFSINIIFFLIGTLIIINSFDLFEDIIFFISITSLPLILSFLIFNFPKPKLFFGDSGSIPVGFLIGYILVYLFSLKIYLPALFLFLYPILDITITLIDKIIFRKKAPWERLFDYFFLKPVVNKKKGHEFMFLNMFVINSSNLLFLVIYLYSKNVIFFLAAALTNILFLFYFSKISK